MIFLVDSMGLGGSERTVQILLNNLKNKEKCNMLIISIINNFKYKINNKVKKFVIFNCKYLNSFYRIILLPIVILKINLGIKELPNKKIFSFHFYSNIVNIILKMIFKSKAYIFERQYSEKYFGNYNIILKYIINYFYNKADLIICNDIEIKESLCKFYKISNKIQIMNNLLDITNIDISSIQKKSIIPKEVFTYITIGRLSEEKNTIDAIKAYELIKNENNRLLIIGRGKLEKYLKNYVLEHNLNKNVFFIGNTDNPFNFLYNSDVFIFTSKHEGFPNVILEAMYCKLPIISYNFKAGINTILDKGKYGIIVDNNIKELSIRMKELENNVILHEKYSKLSSYRIKEFTNVNQYISLFNKFIQ